MYVENSQASAAIGKFLFNLQLEDEGSSANLLGYNMLCKLCTYIVYYPLNRTTG
jgi:hypothetical protein